MSKVLPQSVTNNEVSPALQRLNEQRYKKELLQQMQDYDRAVQKERNRVLQAYERNAEQKKMGGSADLEAIQFDPTNLPPMPEGYKQYKKEQKNLRESAFQAGEERRAKAKYERENMQGPSPSLQWYQDRADALAQGSPDGVPQMDAAPPVPEGAAAEMPVAEHIPGAPRIKRRGGAPQPVEELQATDSPQLPTSQQTARAMLSRYGKQINMRDATSFSKERAVYNPGMVDADGTPVLGQEQRFRELEEIGDQYKKGTNFKGYDQETYEELAAAYPFNPKKMKTVPATFRDAATAWSQLSFADSPSTQSAMWEAGIGLNNIESPVQIVQANLGVSPRAIATINIASGAQLALALAAEKKKQAEDDAAAAAGEKADDRPSQLDQLKTMAGFEGVGDAINELYISKDEALARDSIGMPWDDFVRILGALNRRRADSTHLNRADHDPTLATDFENQIADNLGAMAHLEAGYIQKHTDPDSGREYALLTYKGKRAFRPFHEMATESDPLMKGKSQLVSGKSGGYIGRRGESRRGPTHNKNIQKTPEAMQDYYDNTRTRDKYIAADVLYSEDILFRGYLDYREAQLAEAVYGHKPYNPNEAPQDYKHADKLPYVQQMVKGFGAPVFPFETLTPEAADKVPEGSEVFPVTDHKGNEVLVELKSDGKFRLSTHPHQIQMDIAEANESNDGRPRNSMGSSDPISRRDYNDTVDMNSQTSLVQRAAVHGRPRFYNKNDFTLHNWNTMKPEDRIFSEEDINSMENFLRSPTNTPSKKVLANFELLSFASNVIPGTRELTLRATARLLTKGVITQYANMNKARKTLFPHDTITGKAKTSEIQASISKDLPNYVAPNDKQGHHPNRQYETGANTNVLFDKIDQARERDEGTPGFLETFDNMFSTLNSDRKKRGFKHESMDFADRFEAMQLGKIDTFQTHMRVDADMKSAGRAFQAMEQNDRKTISHVGYMLTAAASDGNLFPNGSPRKMYFSASKAILKNGFKDYSFKNLTNEEKEDVMDYLHDVFSDLHNKAGLDDNAAEVEDKWSKLPMMVFDYGKDASAMTVETLGFIKYLKDNVYPGSNQTWFESMMMNFEEYDLTEADLLHVLDRLHESTLRDLSGSINVKAVKNAQRLANILDVKVVPLGYFNEQKALYNVSTEPYRDENGIPYSISMQGQTGGANMMLSVPTYSTGTRAKIKKDPLTGEQYQGGFGSQSENAVRPALGHYNESVTIMDAHREALNRTGSLFQNAYHENVFDNIIGEPAYVWLVSHIASHETFKKVAQSEPTNAYYDAWRKAVNKKIQKYSKTGTTTGSNGELPGIQETFDFGLEYHLSDRANPEGKSKESIASDRYSKQRLIDAYNAGFWKPSFRAVTDFWAEQGQERQDYLLLGNKKLFARDTRENKVQQITPEAFGDIVAPMYLNILEDLGEWNEIYERKGEGSRAELLDLISMHENGWMKPGLD